MEREKREDIRDGGHGHGERVRESSAKRGWWNLHVEVHFEATWE